MQVAFYLAGEITQVKKSQYPGSVVPLAMFCMCTVCKVYPVYPSSKLCEFIKGGKEHIEVTTSLRSKNYHLFLGLFEVPSRFLCQSLTVKPTQHPWQGCGRRTVCPQEGCSVNQIQPLCPEQVLGMNFNLISGHLPLYNTWSMTMIRPLSITVLRRCAIVITVQLMNASLWEIHFL